jgi:hypothetical protein
MASPDQKPLPRIPGASPFTALTPEARTHLSKFIRHILTEEHSLRLDLRETWARLFENVLDDFTNSVFAGDWLSALKRNRQWVRSQKKTVNNSRDAGTDKGSVVSTTSNKKRANTVDTMGSRHSEGHAHGEDHSCSSTRSAHSVGSTDHTLALNQLRLLLSGTTPSSSGHSATHLLLSLARTTPKDNSSTPACIFKSGTFTLPDDSIDNNCVVLYGLREWDGQ